MATASGSFWVAIFGVASLAVVLGDALQLQGAVGSSYPPEGGPSHFLFVAVDDTTIAQSGPWPLSRSLYGEAIDRLQLAGAKAVVLKFFFDQASNHEADDALEAAVGRMPVLMQYSLDPSGPATSTFDPSDSALAPLDISDPIKGNPTMGPIPGLLSKARGLGFVNARSDPEGSSIEAVGRVGTATVASLQLLTIEAAYGHPLVGQRTLAFPTGGTFEVGRDGRVACPYMSFKEPEVLSLQDFISGKVPVSELNDRVVLIGFIGSTSPTERVLSAQIPIHRVFFRQVDCLQRLLESGSTSR